MRDKEEIIFRQGDTVYDDINLQKVAYYLRTHKIIVVLNSRHISYYLADSIFPPCTVNKVFRI